MAIVYIPMYRVCIGRSYNVGAGFTDREAQKIRKETILTTLIGKGFGHMVSLVSVGSGGHFISKAS
jgi:hypothetical protein